MKIELHEISIRDLAKGYENNLETGSVVGYGGILDIRPPYQREFIYKDAQRNAVIETVRQGFPLNVMYWVVREDGTYEVLDGQQRTISVCGFVNDHFTVNYVGFDNLQKDEREQILNYKLQIYFCEGTDSEKLKWFRTINIAGERLTDQELRNAVYHGSWVTDAKRWFSKTNGPGYRIGKDYLSGSPIRQEFLETALDWISGGKIEEYMSQHQHDANADELWNYFRNVIDWVQATFPTYRKEMKGIDWGKLHGRFKDQSYDVTELESRIAKLMADDDVTKKSGIYEYVLTGEERCLNVRAFSETMKRGAYERQSGNCPKCGKHFSFAQMEADHITPWSAGGKTVTENCQMLCKDCNRRKAGK